MVGLLDLKISKPGDRTFDPFVAATLACSLHGIIPAIIIVPRLLAVIGIVA